MARWKLMNPHYLNVIPGAEWESKETDVETGRQARKVYKVPMYLDPKDPKDCNYPGEVIVCHEGKGQSKDIEFVGLPTPDMEPLDDEAREITAAHSHKWLRPFDELPMTMAPSVEQSEIAELKAQIRDLRAILEPNAKARRI